MGLLFGNMGLCPACNGSGRVPTHGAPFAELRAGYDAHTATLPCQNCGGQKMFGVPMGLVPLRPDGAPCRHAYAPTGRARNYTRHECEHCGDAYDVDTGG